MGFEIKYISSGDVPDLCDVPGNKIDAATDGEVCPPKFKSKESSPNIAESFIEINKPKDPYQRNGSHYIEKDGRPIFLPSQFCHSPNFWAVNNINSPRPNMNYPQIQNCNNNLQHPPLHYNFPSNTNNKYQRRIEYGKINYDYGEPGIYTISNDNSITRCCCCGRNRVYDEDSDIQMESSNVNGILQEHRVVQYNRREFVVPQRNLYGVHEVAREHVFRHVSSNRNTRPMEPLHSNVGMCNLIEGSNDELKTTIIPIDSGNSSIIGVQEPVSPLQMDTLFSVPDGGNENKFSNKKINSSKKNKRKLIKNNNDSDGDSCYTSDSSLDIDTESLCRFVSEELKKNSISQATFARKVLNRSQGTLSDMLRNPKPWNQLKTGRVTFVRMHRWSCLPEDVRARILNEDSKFACPERMRRRNKPKDNVIEYIKKNVDNNV
uniref:Homeobox protein onecut (inferred by orthology to a D. melanogaster protein) n=1 Tax=Strongyloides venezuelensis TaxID=75913 RepID=A0A0K0G235_STRVS